MRVSDIMTADPIVVAPDRRINDLMTLMDEHDVRHLPVVEDDRLIGLVSQRDLLLATGWLPLSSSAAPLCARDVLEPAVVTMGPDDSVVSLALELELRRMGCMPVVSGEKIVGIVTETDVLGRMASGWKDLDPPVSELMTPSPVVTAPDALAVDAERKCREFGFRHLPVVRGDNVVGIVSDRDLRRFRGRALPEDTRVETIMTTMPIVVEQDCSASLAADHMVTQRLSALPVISAGRVVGIVSVTDLLAHCQNHLREAEA